jgi:hypothetical protein
MMCCGKQDISGNKEAQENEMSTKIMFSALGIMAVLASVAGTLHSTPVVAMHSSPSAVALASPNASQITSDGVGWD